MYSFATKYDYGKLYGTALSKLAEDYSQASCEDKEPEEKDKKSKPKKQEKEDDETKKSE